MKGITIQIETRKQTGVDDLNRPTYEPAWEDVENVLIGEPSSDDIRDTLDLTGKRLAYTLAIPKGDSHDWRNVRVSFFGQTFRTIGEPTQGIEALIPLQWNAKVKVEHYE